VRSHGTRRALAKSNAALAAHFNLQNCLTLGSVPADAHFAILKSCGVVRPQAGIGHEQHMVVELLTLHFQRFLSGATFVGPGGAHKKTRPALAHRPGDLSAESEPQSGSMPVRNAVEIGSSQNTLLYNSGRCGPINVCSMAPTYIRAPDVTVTSVTRRTY
jgi:hypothetical protein